MRIKVFTVGHGDQARYSGDKLTTLISEWIESHEKGLEIIATHTACNANAYMVTITYKPN